MKKEFLLFAMMLLPMVADAEEEVYIDGIYYNIIVKMKKAEVTKNPNGGYKGSVDIPATVTYNGVECNVTGIGYRAFLNSYVTSVTIPNSVTTIGDEAFQYCSNLTSITIPNSVMSLGDHAFAACGLTSVTIPNSVTSMGGGAFASCESLTSATIGDGVKSIESSCFYECRKLSSVTIGNSVESIKDWAFYPCKSLTSITIPSSVTYLGFRAFGYCDSLTSITIPNSVTSTDTYVFQGCNKLSSVTIGNGLKYIAEGLFCGCESLSSITIPDNVTSIGMAAFQQCYNLKSVTIPNNVTYLGQYAFSYCKGLTTVTIGSSVKTIDFGVFASCQELADVYCLAKTVPDTKTDVFNDSYIEYSTLHVPVGCVKAYQSIEPWKNFMEIVEISNEPAKCATPTIAFTDGKLKFSCETQGVEYEYEIVKKGNASEVAVDGTYKVSVYAKKEGYKDSDVSTLEFSLDTGGEVCDVNKDGAVNVADIATIIDKMASWARMQEEAEE